MSQKFYRSAIADMQEEGVPVEIIHPLFPEISLPPGCASADAALRRLAARGLQHRYGKWECNRPDVQQRCEHELQIIIREGVSPYFLILHDAVQWAREQGIPVGPGRGAAAGSLLCFALGITSIDPVLYGLQFERLYNPTYIHAKGLFNCPDIDVDFGANARAQVLQYIQQRYGADQAMRFITVDRRGRRDVHSCGIAIAHRGALQPLPRWCVPATGQEVLALEQHELEKLGIVTYDMLGMSQLDKLQKLEAAAGGAADPNAHPGQYSPALDLFREGRTEGIWLFSSGEMQQLLRGVQLQSFSDLCSLSTIYRPGLRQHIPDFMANTRPHAALLPAHLKNLLQESRGIRIYQEQSNLILQGEFGISLEQADQQRRLLSQGRLIGWSDPPTPSFGIQELTQESMPVTFCKAHAVAYTSIALRQAWIKATRPDLWDQYVG